MPGTKVQNIEESLLINIISDFYKSEICINHNIVRGLIKPKIGDFIFKSELTRDHRENPFLPNVLALFYFHITSIKFKKLNYSHLYIIIKKFLRNTYSPRIFNVYY